jgi:hypothetical protein
MYLAGDSIAKRKANFAAIYHRLVADILLMVY